MRRHTPPYLYRRTLLASMAGLGTLGQSSCIPHSRAYYQAQSVPAPGSDGKIPLAIGTYGLSPDGRVIAFGFGVNPNRPAGLGLYDWPSGKLTRLPTMPGLTFSSPSFSSDGTKLALIANPKDSSWASILAAFDLGTSQYTLLPEAHVSPPHDLRAGGIWSVLFQPNTDRLLYSHSEWACLSLIELADRRVTTILPLEKGFYYINGMTFAGQNELWFEANSPRLPHLAASTLTGATYLFRLELGGEPELLFPQFNHLRVPEGAGYNSFAVAGDFKTIVAIGLNLAEPSTPGHGYNREMFRLTRDGQVEQLTNLRGYLRDTAISLDGSTACFGASPTYGAPQDLYLLDLATNRITPSGLLSAIQQNPDIGTRT